MWYLLLKSVNCISTFEKMLQSGPFQTKSISTINKRVTCQLVIFFIYFF